MDSAIVPVMAHPIGKSALCRVPMLTAGQKVPAEVAGILGRSAAQGFAVRRLLWGQKAGPDHKERDHEMQADHACNFGFIQPSGGFADAFAHCSAIQSFGFMSVEEGQSVEYKIEAGPPKDAVMGDEDLAGNHSLLRLL
ncbi:cold shock domain-containing protein [Glutamicibacter sp. NPDC087661]|uniref:cold shock domain-containing protein n=2 Tax=Micrococcales TaxID=85006 RepID=UPI00381F6663